MYELKKFESYLRVNMLGPGPRLLKKRIYRAAVSQMLRNSGQVTHDFGFYCGRPLPLCQTQCIYCLLSAQAVMLL